MIEQIVEVGDFRRLQRRLLLGIIIAVGGGGAVVIPDGPFITHDDGSLGGVLIPVPHQPLRERRDDAQGEHSKQDPSSSQSLTRPSAGGSAHLTSAFLPAVKGASKAVGCHRGTARGQSSYYLRPLTGTSCANILVSGWVRKCEIGYHTPKGR